MKDAWDTPFEPPKWLKGGHAQTLAGRYWPERRVCMRSRLCMVDAGDGDRLVYLDQRPEGWVAGDPVALFVHGLAGDAQSSYVRRLAARLVGAGVRAARMNLRGAGAGFGLARGIYHAGRTGDLRAVARGVIEGASGSRLAIVGFSLGANLVLKLAAESAEEPVAGLDCVVACNPPLDLEACCEYLKRPGGRAYDRHLAGLLVGEVHRLHRRFPELGAVDLKGVCTVYDFDECYTAPRNGFRSVREYYAKSSCGPLLREIQADGLVIHARDDPFIPIESFLEFAFPESLELHLSAHGGHLGYLSRPSREGSRRWLDHHVTSWLLKRWKLDRFRNSDPN